MGSLAIRILAELGFGVPRCSFHLVGDTINHGPIRLPF